MGQTAMAANGIYPIDVATYTYQGFTVDQLKETFAQVKNPEDWKGPIDMCVEGEDVLSVVAGIQFFTATIPQVDYNPERGNAAWHITSKGYRKGPAGP